MARMDENRTNTSLKAIFLAIAICCVAAAVWQSEVLPGLKFFVTFAASSLAAALVLPYSVAAGVVAGTVAVVVLLEVAVGFDPLDFAMTWLFCLPPVWVFALLGKELRIYLSA